MPSIAARTYSNSYSTKTVATVTTFIRSIRSMHAMAPAGGSVFKLQHQDRRHCHHLHQIYQIHACDGPRQRLRFQVTAPRPSPLSPPSPDLSDPCMRWPPPEAPFSGYGTKTVATVTTFTRSIRSYMRWPSPEAPFSSYGTKTVAAVTTFTRSIRSMHAMDPAGGSVFKLRHQDCRHCHHLHQIYQIYATNTPARSSC